MGTAQLIECGEALSQACEELLLPSDSDCQFSDIPSVPYLTPSPSLGQINVVKSGLDSRYKCKLFVCSTLCARTAFSGFSHTFDTKNNYIVNLCLVLKLTASLLRSKGKQVVGCAIPD